MFDRSQGTSLFIGLARPVSFMGMPLNYVIVFGGGVLLAFLVTESFLLLIITTPIAYFTIRSLAAYDAKLIDTLLISLRSTQLDPALFTKKGLTYRA